MSNKRVATNWDSKETWERLVSAIIASGVKLDLREIAKFYGTTYDTLENRLRKVKKDAAILKEEVNTGERAEIPTCRTAPTTPKKPRTPKTPKSVGNLDGRPYPILSDDGFIANMWEAVVNGRVSKATQSRTSTASSVKQEMYSTGNSFLTDASIFDDTSYLHGVDGSFGMTGYAADDVDTSLAFH